MNKVENILEYYLLTNKLKDTIRSGWKMWNVKKQRLESVAEHVFGTCMLAISIWSETLPTINLAEVLMTLAIHETEEIVIGDLTPFDANYAQKNEKGIKAVQDIFKNLIAKDVYITLIDNFNKKSTPEAIFAYKCDKLECDLQAKLYDEQGYMKFELADKKIKDNEKIKSLQKVGVKSPSLYFVYYDKAKFTKNAEKDDIFVQLSKYIEKNNISNLLNKRDIK